MAQVLVCKADYENIEPVVRNILEVFPLDVSGKRVLLKPNAVGAATPEDGITTHPSLVKVLVDVLVKQGASVLVGDNPEAGGRRPGNREVFLTSGLLDAAGPNYINLSDDAARVKTSHPSCPEVVVSRPVLEADILISIPKFKTHRLTGLTGAIKNSYGFLPGGQKGDLHLVAETPYRFSEFVASIFGLRPPDLVVVDAVVGMHGDGPDSGEPVHIGKVIAGTDAVAVDRVMAYMMNLSPEWIRTLTYAHEIGLGELDLDRIDVVGDLLPLQDFRLPPRFLGDDPGVLRLRRERRTGFVTQLPVPDRDLCHRCMSCLDRCPVGALEIREGLPLADQDRCTMCFCCKEFCPEGARVTPE